MNINQTNNLNSLCRMFFICGFLLLFLFSLVLPGIAAAGAPPKNVIFLIGDGMGFEQVRAAGMYLNGVEGTLSFEYLPYQGQVTTYSADSSVTDSAAAATAMATGTKVNNGVISMEFPWGQQTNWRLCSSTFKIKARAPGWLQRLTSPTPHRRLLGHMSIVATIPSDRR